MLICTRPTLNLVGKGSVMAGTVTGKGDGGRGTGARVPRPPCVVLFDGNLLDDHVAAERAPTEVRFLSVLAQVEAGHLRAHPRTRTERRLHQLEEDRKSTRLNSSHATLSRMPSS